MIADFRGGYEKASRTVARSQTGRMNKHFFRMDSVFDESKLVGDGISPLNAILAHTMVSSLRVSRVVKR
jgi:hypothetical protein